MLKRLKSDLNVSQHCIPENYKNWSNIGAINRVNKWYPGFLAGHKVTLFSEQNRSIFVVCTYFGAMYR